MSEITDLANNAWRDFDDPFAPSPGTEHEPEKSEIRGVFAYMDTIVLRGMVLTQDDYDALIAPDPVTLYVIISE